MAEQPNEAQKYIIVRPDPDASPASMALVVREIGTLKEQATLRNDAITVRFDAMDRAVQLFQENLTRVPTEVQREVGHLRELLVATLKGEAEGNYRELLTRLNDMDEAIKLVQAYREKLPIEIDDKLGHLKELLVEIQAGDAEKVLEHFKILEEKFNGISKQFELNDKALSAALSTAKEAVSEQTKNSKESIDKSEKNMLEAIKQQRDLLQTNYQSLNDKLALFDKTTRDLLQAYDVRLTRFEGQDFGRSVATAGQHEDQRAHQATSSYTAYLIFAGAGLLVGITGIILAIVK